MILNLTQRILSLLTMSVNGTPSSGLQANSETSLPLSLTARLGTKLYQAYLFILRAESDTLPPLLNLDRWRIQTDFWCPLCNSHYPTSFHALNGCASVLNPGRYFWRHDSVLVGISINMLAEDQSLYADLPSPAATIPPNILLTPYHPDLVLKSGSSISLLELTVCSNSPEFGFEHTIYMYEAIKTGVYGSN